MPRRAPVASSACNGTTQPTSPTPVAFFIDYGEQDGLAYLILEYVDGPTLQERKRQGLSIAPATSATLARPPVADTKCRAPNLVQSGHGQYVWPALPGHHLR